MLVLLNTFSLISHVPVSICFPIDHVYGVFPPLNELTSRCICSDNYSQLINQYSRIDKTQWFCEHGTDSVVLWTWHNSKKKYESIFILETKVTSLEILQIRQNQKFQVWLKWNCSQRGHTEMNNRWKKIKKKKTWFSRNYKIFNVIC